ncbi:hypothetical protein HMI54_003613 [Coelomomyces lativittatus]|nr:hypothetical protein HMI54_003613 [Coelomomyces lativittatus]
MLFSELFDSEKETMVTTTTTTLTSNVPPPSWPTPLNWETDFSSFLMCYQAFTLQQTHASFRNTHFMSSSPYLPSNPAELYLIGVKLIEVCEQDEVIKEKLVSFLSLTPHSPCLDIIILTLLSDFISNDAG